MIKIYTAGKMLGLTYQEQMDWRYKIENMIENKTDQLIKFIHPPLVYNYIEPSHKTEQEVMNWDLSHLKDCDIVIVNLEEIESSIGTIFEMAAANELNHSGHKHIYIVGFGHTDKSLHPWIELSLHRKEDTLEDAADYVAEYLLD